MILFSMLVTPSSKSSFPLPELFRVIADGSADLKSQEMPLQNIALQILYIYTYTCINYRYMIIWKYVYKQDRTKCHITKLLMIVSTCLVSMVNFQGIYYSVFQCPIYAYTCYTKSNRVKHPSTRPDISMQ